MLSATYSPDDNKLRLYSIARLDAETFTRVKAAGFRWAPQQKLFVAPMWTPDRADLLIDLCGEIGDEDSTLVDRAEERAERFGQYSERRAADADRAHESVKAIADHIPLGQPILVGHHSERHARRDAERIENGMRRAVKMWETSKYWTARAAGALHHAKYKELPRVRANRIKTIEADKRRQERAADEARKWITVWGGLYRPGKDATAAPTEEIIYKRALMILNYAHMYEMWSELDKRAITPREALIRACRALGRRIYWAQRWITHYDLRLGYEKAMLAEQGASELIAPQPRRVSAKSQLPLCNYRAPEGITYQNLYHQNEPMHAAQVEMTAAEYKQISSDYKGTRVVDNSHRIRTTMQRSSIVCVFLTDSKVHAKPEPKAPPARTLLPASRPLVERTESAPDPKAATFDALRQTLKAGVQVVTAPQLFPTPPELARRVAELADIQPGMRVLEPSAGTARIIIAIQKTAGTDVDLTAVEIKAHLADILRSAYRVPTHCRDFLQCNGELGTFDRIVMNPPFQNGDDIKHIQHARRLLNPGGRLVAICANGPRQRAALEPIAHEWIDLPAGTFSEEGTNVNTAIVILGAEES
jgi:phospholipid N-methyltransferase